MTSIFADVNSICTMFDVGVNDILICNSCFQFNIVPLFGQLDGIHSYDLYYNGKAFDVFITDQSYFMFYNDVFCKMNSMAEIFNLM